LILISFAVLQGCAPLVVVGGAAAVSAAHDRRTLGAQIDDQAIELKALSAISADKELVEKTHINVASINGVVLLSGQASTSELRDRVLNAARAVPGVRRIVNEISVAAPATLGSRSNDTWLTTKVKTSMLTKANLDASRVKVVTESAVVYLLGLVTRAEGDLATDAARSVNGVQRVVKLFEYID
jgi:osmotically-inducible protein OsmY